MVVAKGAIVVATTAIALPPPPPPPAAPPTPAPSSDDGVAADPQAGFKTLAKQVADMTTELSLLRAETKMLRDAMVENGVLRSRSGVVVRDAAAVPAGFAGVPTSSLQARIQEAQQLALEYGGAGAGREEGGHPPPRLDGDVCTSPGPPPFSPLSDMAGPRTPDRPGNDDAQVAASVPASRGSPLSGPDRHGAALVQRLPDTPQRRRHGVSRARVRQPGATSAPRPAKGTSRAKAIAAAPTAPGSRSDDTTDPIFSRAHFGLDPDSSPMVARAHSLPGLPERRRSLGTSAPARVVAETQPRPARLKRYKDVEYEWKTGQGGDVLLLKPTPEQYADLKGNQDDCPLLFLCAEELGARRHGAFIIEVPEASRPALPEQTPRERVCTVYKQQKLASGFWRLYTSSGRRTLPPPGALEPVGLDEATREFEKRLSVGKTLQRVAYETDIPAHTSEERAEALLPQESPVYPLRGNKLETTGIPGIHTPSAYRGTACAPFAWHFEDLKLGAINCLYRGQKVWFVTEPGSFDAASKVFGEVTKKAVDHDQFLRHDALHYGASHLRSQGIVTRAFMQEAWQMVAVYPGAYHSGFSATGTLAEAVNYADHWWTAPVGYRPCSEKCHPGRQPITLEQLIPGERRQSTEDPLPSPTSIKVKLKPLLPAARAIGNDEARPAKKATGKRPASARPSDASVGEPPPKRAKDPNRPPALEVLALELTGPPAEERLRRHMSAYSEYPQILPRPWDDGADWVQQTNEYINLGNEMKRKGYSTAPADFTKLVGLATRARAVQSIHTRAGDIGGESGTRVLPKHLTEQVRESLGIESKAQPFRFWVAAQRKFIRLGLEYAPFLPFESSRDAAFRDYERVGNNEIETLRTMLGQNPRAQRLARAGRALIARILGEKDFLWEHISNGNEDLENLDDDTMISLVPIRHAGENHIDDGWKPPQEMPELERPDAVQGKHCELCEEETCGCIRTCFPQEPRVSFARPNGLSVRAAAAYKKGDLIGEAAGLIVSSPNAADEGGQAVDFIRNDGSSPPVPRVVGRISTESRGNIFRFCRYRCGDAEAKLVSMAISGRCRMVLVAERDVGDGDEISIKTQRKAEPCACVDCAS
ncbi:hypothetical protein MAPG_06301 [Magnaporthiopsis poae ATCC 64411]|uniref:JmjC domain-containing protein n=1 Tax=Magnaporthiopsis poae (strain ATCC 64411 / 73-15) TaxID=644358 RepID=A0A0C4E1N6_MAGP6|nr:hypothetical protein MAPG_06301 [Magnaporthiopsis poae ATCC 64411]